MLRYVSLILNYFYFCIHAILFYVFIPLFPKPLNHPSPSLCIDNSLYQLGFLWLQRKASQLKPAWGKREMYYKKTGVSHETEGQGCDYTATVGNNRIRGMNAGNMHSLHSFSLLLLVHRQCNSDCHCFSSTKRQKTKQLTVLKLHSDLCWKLLGRDTD